MPLRTYDRCLAPPPVGAGWCYYPPTYCVAGRWCACWWWAAGETSRSSSSRRQQWLACTATAPLLGKPAYPLFGLCGWSMIIVFRGDKNTASIPPSRQPVVVPRSCCFLGGVSCIASTVAGGRCVLLLVLVATVVASTMMDPPSSLFFLSRSKFYKGTRQNLKKICRRLSTHKPGIKNAPIKNISLSTTFLIIFTAACRHSVRNLRRKQHFY